LVNLPDLPCTFVVPDNAGGGIFSFLPQAGAVAAPTFEHLFGTPPTSKAAEVARGFGLPVREVTTVVGLEEALADAAASPRPGLIRAMVPGRAENVALHDAVNEAVRLALT
jgi:2-succinyl-5-enolpyruvyl-6-hydroxy-3-cyclohexene-1-carboxylate synthase